MRASYKKLWKLLVDKDMSKGDLRVALLQEGEEIEVVEYTTLEILSMKAAKRRGRVNGGSEKNMHLPRLQYRRHCGVRGGKQVRVRFMGQPT